MAPCEGGAGPKSESELESECELEVNESSRFRLPSIGVCSLPRGAETSDVGLGDDRPSITDGGSAGPNIRGLFDRPSGPLLGV